MANQKLSQLPAITEAVGDSAELYVNDAGTSKKIEAQYVQRYLSAGKLQCFTFRLTNDGGTLKHVFLPFADVSSETAVPSTQLIDRINSAQTGSLIATPTGADATTAFAGGAKISSVSTHQVFFDTVDQGDGLDAIGTISLVLNNTGTALLVRPIWRPLDIDGVDFRRPGISFYSASDTDTLFPLNTTSIASGKQVWLACWFYVK